MDILEQLEEKVKAAVQKIENLESKIRELENEKAQNNKKLQGLIDSLDQVSNDNESQEAAEEEDESDQGNGDNAVAAEPAIEQEANFGHEQSQNPF